ncbi:MAG: DEAD/DEAH box helicase, partial [Gemmatimonadales bacterium]
HSAIRNLMIKVAEHAALRGKPVRLVKAGPEEDELDTLESHGITTVESKEAAAACDGGPFVLGGTAWVFSRDDLQQPAPRLDYLFVDEAGQVSLANLVGMGSAARNLVLIGDQMQLAQPVKGSHPDESGDSCLEYALQDHATVPPDRGVFLPTTWRMHPEICEFISAAVYEGRLHGAPVTRTHRLHPAGPGSVNRGTGIILIDVEHEGNTQDCEEEVAAIGGVIDQLDATTVEIDGTVRAFDRTRDVLVVAPYNLQVRRLRDALPGVQVGTVDKFQGLEAPVVIVSMCASSLDDAPRGAAFLLNPNRLNVAISRAQCLAVVVGSPDLAMTRCTSVAEMKLVNLYCHLRDYATGTLTQ